jgi:hypothetical protein
MLPTQMMMKSMIKKKTNSTPMKKGLLEMKRKTRRTGMRSRKLIMAMRLKEVVTMTLISKLQDNLKPKVHSREAEVETHTISSNTEGNSTTKATISLESQVKSFTSMVLELREARI